MILSSPAQHFYDVYECSLETFFFSFLSRLLGNSGAPFVTRTFFSFDDESVNRSEPMWVIRKKPKWLIIVGRFFFSVWGAAALLFLWAAIVRRVIMIIRSVRDLERAHRCEREKKAPTLAKRFS